jgi:hypothetical protein
MLSTDAARLVENLQGMPVELLRHVLEHFVFSSEAPSHIPRLEPHNSAIGLARIRKVPATLPNAVEFQQDAWITCIEPWATQRSVDLDFPTEFHQEEYTFMLKKGYYEYFTLNEFRNIEGLWTLILGQSYYD